MNRKLSESFCNSVQVAFICVMYPSLSLGYIGQAAYLSKNLSHIDHGFFHSIPSKLKNYLPFGFNCCKISV